MQSYRGQIHGNFNGKLQEIQRNLPMQTSFKEMLKAFKQTNNFCLHPVQPASETQKTKQTYQKIKKIFLEKKEYITEEKLAVRSVENQASKNIDELITTLDTKLNIRLYFLLNIPEQKEEEPNTVVFHEETSEAQAFPFFNYTHTQAKNSIEELLALSFSFLNPNDYLSARRVNRYCHEVADNMPLSLNLILIDKYIIFLSNMVFLINPSYNELKAIYSPFKKNKTNESINLTKAIKKLPFFQHEKRGIKDLLDSFLSTKSVGCCRRIF